MRRRWVSLLHLVLLAPAATIAAAQTAGQPFPHERHAGLFPLCTACHPGAVEPGQPLYPAAAACGACHDGAVRPPVAWAPAAAPRASNLRFTHAAHAGAVLARRPGAGDTTLARRCGACHNEGPAPRMQVRPPVVGQCLACHDLAPSHYGNPDPACATCHVPLALATRLTRDRVARFPRPPSHDVEEFAPGGHGRAAATPGAGPETIGVAASCATCHARDFCEACHVNAAESAVIQALQPDPRSLALAPQLPVPAAHRSAGFLRHHAKDAPKNPAACRTCHTQESCLTCHGGAPPPVVATLLRARGERPPGARVERRRPPSHTGAFREQHGPEANSRPSSCEGCHVRADCLACHRPDPGRGTGYHPEGFLSRHPASAYARETTCTDCHNQAQFCQECHRRGGLAATRRLGTSSYHDGFRGFSLGHGQAARQNLESCVSCHVERDCTTCHAAVGGGFGFNPHGPGFNPERLKRKNPTSCVACHGTAIP